MSFDQPVIAEEPAPAEAGGRNPESEHWRPSVFMLDARLIGRFPLMQLAWIPACAGMTWVEGTWAPNHVGKAAQSVPHYLAQNFEPHPLGFEPLKTVAFCRR